MKTYECPQRDFELRLNDSDTLTGDQRLCPAHYVPLVHNQHEVGKCQEIYDVVGGSLVWRCSNDPGVKAYDTAGAA